MNRTLAILGAGHLGQQIAHYAISDGHYNKVVFFDDFSKDSSINEIPILGRLEDVESEFKKGTFDEIIIGVGYKHLEFRKKMFETFKDKIPFGKIVHSSSWVDPTAKINSGVVVYPMCTIDASSIISENTIVNINCSIAHDTIVGKHCFLSPRAALAGFIRIEELCIVGINSTIIDNLNIIERTQIGGGTVVIKDIVKSGLYVGNPHKFIR